MSRLSLRSPAKLNLALRIIHKRPDGFHRLQTLFERIDLCDRLELTLNRSGRIRLICEEPGLRRAKRNLVYRAAVMLQQRFRIKMGVDIQLIKNIPLAAGLGGGSSNAATALKGLNRLWRLGLSAEDLNACGQALGSDVPFFLHNSSWALGTGRGDIIKPLVIDTKIWHVLVVPRTKIYSREVFTRVNLQLTKTTANVNILIRSLRNNTIYNNSESIYNDLEDAIIKTCPRLFSVKNRLSGFFPSKVIFSGSGPAVFGIVSSKKSAVRLADKLRRFYSRVFVVRTF